MPNKLISQFEDNLNPLGSDVFPIVNNGITKKQSLSGLTSFFSGSTDTYITGGTYSDGTTVFTYNTGGTFSVTGYSTGSTDTYVTGGTYSDGTAIFTNNFGDSFSVTGFSTGTTSFDVYVTGGTYLDGITVFTNNTGGTFSVTGYSTGFTVQDVSATGSGIVNNVSLQELGGVDKLINGVRIGRGPATDGESVVFGINSQSGTTTGAENHSFGFEALRDIKTGNYNTAFGWGVLQKNTSGSSNTGFGNGALQNNITSTFNTAFGGGALQSFSGSSGFNTAFGASSMIFNLIGQRNTAVGSGSGIYIRGSQNTIVGSNAGGGGASANVSGNTGSNNISVGFQAGRALTSGNNNILIENITNDSINTGNFNIIIDPRNKAGVNSGNNNVLIGGWDGAFGTNISDTIALGTGGGTTRFLSDAFGTTLPQQTIALITAEATGKAIVTKEYLNDINTNVVHKTLVESITGQKTFSAQTLYYDTMNLKNGWFITDAGTKVGIRRLPNNPDSAAGLQVEGPMLVNNGAIEFATGDVVRNVFAQGAFDILRLRNYNTGEPSTLLDISARVGDPTSDTREATLSLTRGDDTVNAEFLDFYNNGYFTGASIEVQYGIRIQKRGTGVYRPFIFDWNDGTTKDKGFIAEQTTGFTFFKPVVVNHLTINSLTGGTSINNLGIDANGNVVTGSSSTTHWSAGTGTNAIATRNGNNIASGNYALAEGNQTQSTGQASHAEGYSSKALNTFAHAEGNNSTASGGASHSEGQFTIASGSASHAEGAGTQAIGNYSHAQGQNTIASGETSHAGGNNSQANGINSFVHGRDSRANADYSIVLGRNITGTTSNTTYVDSLNIKTVPTTGTSVNNLGIDANGRVVVGTTGGGGISGSGTTNYIPKWSSTTNLTNSLILDNGTNVGIGVIDTNYKLNVDGGLKTYGLYTPGMIIQTTEGGSVWSFQRGQSTGDDNFEILNFGRINVDFFIANYTGNIVINSYTDNLVDKLQVNGSASATQYNIPALNTPPASSGDTGTLGEIRYTDEYIYVCIATNTWKRTPLTTW